MVERDLAAVNDYVVHRYRRSPAPEDKRLRLAVRVARDDHVAGVHALVAELEAPVADDRILGIDAEVACAAPGEGKPRRQRREYFRVHVRYYTTKSPIGHRHRRHRRWSFTIFRLCSCRAKRTRAICLLVARFLRPPIVAPKLSFADCRLQVRLRPGSSPRANASTPLFELSPLGIRDTRRAASRCRLRLGRS